MRAQSRYGESKLCRILSSCAEICRVAPKEAGLLTTEAPF